MPSFDRLRQLRDVTAAGEAQQNWIDGSRNMLSSVADRGAQFISDFVQHGSSAFKSLWDDFKTWALDAFAKIAAQTVIVNLAGAFSGQLGQLAANTFAGGQGGAASLLTNGANIFSTGSNLFSGFSAGTGAYGALATSGFGQAVGLSSVVPGSLSLGVEAGATASQAAAGGALGLTSLGAALPYVGVALMIAQAAGLFNKTPSQVQGQYQISGGTSGFEDNASTSTPFGNVGFNDAGTQYFSGQGAQVFNQQISGILSAIATRLTPDQIKQTAGELQGIHFQGMQGHVHDGRLHLEVRRPGDLAGRRRGAAGPRPGDVEAGRRVQGHRRRGRLLRERPARDPRRDHGGPGEAVTDAAKAANQSLADSLTAAGQRAQSLVSSYDGSATATHNLATATTAYQSTLVQLLAQIQQVQAACIRCSATPSAA